jgi:hypothetical protein
LQLGAMIVSPDVDAVIIKPVEFAVMAGVVLEPRALLCGGLLLARVWSGLLLYRFHIPEIYTSFSYSQASQTRLGLCILLQLGIMILRLCQKHNSRHLYF